MHITDTGEMDNKITLNHGSGGKLTGELVREVFTSRFGMTEPLTDSAVIEHSGSDIAFTVDSYVINPIFFPGGNIGKLAVCGTVNDLAVSGAIPLYISASFIIEEGLPLDDLVEIALSMAEEARKAEVRVVTGDTKVVEKGKCDKLFITTAGVGKVREMFRETGTGVRVQADDRLIINGPVGNHSIAVMSARKQLGFATGVISDCASLNHLIGKVLDKVQGIHFMRDLTRGGLATVLNELASITGMGMEVNEKEIPVEEPVKGACEMLGFDPLYLANEGKVLFVVAEEDTEKVIEILRNDPLGKDASVIGRVTTERQGLVAMKTISGGTRILDMHSGSQLPRIC